jgi:iron complex outermembrane receptor protein
MDQRTVFRGAALSALATALLHTAPALAQDAAPASDDAIIVTAQQAQKQVVSDGNLGALGDQDAMSTPFNVTTYTAQLVLDQQAETIGDVMKNDPAVRVTSGSGNQAEQFVVRGFPLFGDAIAIDGLYGITPRQLISPELYEGIQVLNGASAFLFGAPPGGSGVGGGINLTPKRAQKELYRATASFGGKSIFGGNFDAGKRFGDGEELGVRINGVFRKGENSIDNEDKQVAVVGVGIDYRDGPGRVMLDIGYENQQVHQPRPIVRPGAALTAIPAAPADTSYNYGQAWTFTKLRDLYGTLRIELDIAKDVMLYAAFGARDGSEYGEYSTITVLTAAGNGTQARLYVPRADNNEAGQIGLRAKFATGGISHQFNAGASVAFQENRNAFTAGIFPAATRTGTACAGIPAASLTTAVFCSNLYAAPQVAKPADGTLVSAGGNLQDPPRSQVFAFGSVYASDTLGILDDRVLFTAGARYQQIIARGFSKANIETSKYVRDAWTPVFGIVVKPTETVSLYANRMEALVQGPVAPATTVGILNPGQIFDPYKSVQYEVGAKLAVRGLTGTVAAYTTAQPLQYNDPSPTNPAQFTYRVDGEQRNRGIELSLNGEPAEWLRFIGGATYTDAQITRSIAANIGKRAIGVPEWQVSFGTEVVPPFLKNATFTGRIVYTDEQFVNLANTLKIPAWTRFDLGLRYVVVADGHPLTFRVSAENITDKSYWGSASGGYLTIGAPRTFKSSITFEF